MHVKVREYVNVHVYAFAFVYACVFTTACVLVFEHAYVYVHVDAVDVCMYTTSLCLHTSRKSALVVGDEGVDDFALVVLLCSSFSTAHSW